MRGGLLACLLACGSEASLARGEAALERGDLVSAESAFDEVLEREPSNLRAQYGIGWTWHLAGRDAAAQSAFEAAVALDPASPLGYKGLGSLAMAAGRFQEAREQYHRALDRSPDELAILHSLVLVDLSAREGAAALAGVEALIRRYPQQPDLEQTRAETLLLLGRPEDALVAADRAIGLDGVAKVRALVRITRARALLAASAHRLDVRDCVGTGPSVRAWLDQADQMLDEATVLHADAPELTPTRRLVKRRRALTVQICPGSGAESGNPYPGG